MTYTTAPLLILLQLFHSGPLDDLVSDSHRAGSNDRL